jgi:hypothetical protein
VEYHERENGETMTPIKKFVILMRLGMGLEAKDGQWPTPDIDSEQEWLLMMKLAKKQSIQGVIGRGIQMMLEEQHSPRKIYIQACLLNEKAASINGKIDAACVKVAAMLDEARLPCCLLKGQGIALAYPDPTARVPGDIDVWVMAPPKQVIGFARKSLPDAFACYHHVEYVKCDGIEVELHYRPAFLNNPIHNSRLQQWFLSQAPAQLEHRVELPSGAGTVSVPTKAFNRIFMMAHIMNHVIHEGIGIRQMMDYYFLLQQGFTEEEQRHDVQLLRQFGLYHITAAVMFVLQKLFVLPKEQQLVPPDEHRGTFLMNEIFYGGNFGHYSRQSIQARTSWSKNMQRLKRDWRLLTIFPSECLWEPLFRWWHFFWRQLH